MSTARGCCFVDKKEMQPLDLHVWNILVTLVCNIKTGGHELGAPFRSPYFLVKKCPAAPCKQGGSQRVPGSSCAGVIPSL